MKIEKKLAKWLEQGFITETQKQNIIAFEEADKKENKWVFYGMLLLACLAVSVGVISLIAYNWAEIPSWFKLSAGALFLTALAGSYVHNEQSGRAAFAEGALILFFTLILGYIGLTAQVFNLHSQPHRGVLFWVIITAPLAFTAKRAHMPFMWTWAFLTVLPFELAQYEFVEEFIRVLTDDLPYVALTLGLFSFAWLLRVAAPKIFYKFQNISTAAKTYFGILFFITLIGVIICDISGWTHFYRTGQFNVLFAICTAAALAGVVLLSPREELKILTALAIIILAGLFPTPTFAFAEFYGMIYFVLFYMTVAAYFANKNSSRMCNLFIFIAGARLVIAYAKLSGGLLGFGVSMITTGVLAIFFIIVWHKFSSKIRTRLNNFFKSGMQK